MERIRMMSKACRVTLAMSALLSVVAVSGARAGQPVLAVQPAPASQRISMQDVDHRPWTELLAKYVNDRGMVDYQGWQASAADLQVLDNYLTSLTAARETSATPREAKIAFWINAYNAVTVKGILREYPTTSIRNHTARLYGYHIWKDLQLQVNGKSYSLEAIEHEVLRPLGEPRIHFAIVCASIGCPRLLNEAYMAESLEEQLSRNATAFFADAAKFEYDPQRREVRVSPILKWFAEDFGDDADAQLKRIAPYLPDEAVRQAAARGGLRISYLDYDWDLNDQAAVDRNARR
jgi:hypothetical protein